MFFILRALFHAEISLFRPSREMPKVESALLVLEKTRFDLCCFFLVVDQLRKQFYTVQRVRDLEVFLVDSKWGRIILRFYLVRKVLEKK